MHSTPLQESCVTDTHAPNFAADWHRRAFGVAEHWLTALERVLVEHGLVKPDTPRASGCIRACRLRSRRTRLRAVRPEATGLRNRSTRPGRLRHLGALLNLRRSQTSAAYTSAGEP
jgi:hypothetical protein